jgi:phosphatidate cytidylyltransferase
MDAAETAQQDGSVTPAELPRPRSTPIAVRTGLGTLLVLLIVLMLAVDSTWEAGFVYCGVLLAMVALGLHEFAYLARRLGLGTDLRALVIGGVALSLVQWAGMATGAFDPWLWSGALLSALLMGVFGVRIVRGEIGESLQSVGSYVLGWTYVPVMLGFLTAVRLRWGVAGLIAVVGVCKAGSSGAYFAGSLLGRRKLVPRVSPGKTVAGAVGAVVAAVAVSWGLSVSPLGVMTPGAAVVFGLLAALTGIFGDLAESLLKRQADIKDSGSLLPGFGGMLDMLDDVLFTAPLGFVFLSVCESLALGG